MNNIRIFDVIAFTTRHARPHRSALDHYEFDNIDNIPALIVRRTSAHCAMGRNVLVFEFGCLKPDWSRIFDTGLYALMTCTDSDYIRLIRNIDSLRGLGRTEFIGHVDRSFYGRVTPQMRARVSLI